MITMSLPPGIESRPILHALIRAFHVLWRVSLKDAVTPVSSL
jgi:hypothetical protein